MADRYSECDVCGEKFWDEDIESYLHEVVDGDETQMLCTRCLQTRPVEAPRLAGTIPETRIK